MGAMDLWLTLEYGDVIDGAKVEVMTREAGRTKIVMADGSLRGSSLTPLVIDRRTKKFWSEARPARDGGKLWTK